jgi:hypothetical protein
MKRTIKKDINLSKLKTGCSPCFDEAKIMQKKISDRNISDIEKQEFKKIVSSLFKND